MYMNVYILYIYTYNKYDIHENRYDINCDRYDMWLYIAYNYTTFLFFFYPNKDNPR